MWATRHRCASAKARGLLLLLLLRYAGAVLRYFIAPACSAAAAAPIQLHVAGRRGGEVEFLAQTRNVPCAVIEDEQIFRSNR